MSKTVMRYKQEQRDAEYRRQREAELSKMTPEERKAYEERSHKNAQKALSYLAAMNAMTSRYYK
jgi:hypothetical protein